MIGVNTKIHLFALSLAVGACRAYGAGRAPQRYAVINLGLIKSVNSWPGIYNHLNLPGLKAYQYNSSKEK